MDGPVRGMPLLGEEAPPQGDDHECRKCGKAFVPLLVRSRDCAHCGYSYCHSCSEAQALKQRTDGTGYTPLHVCQFCIEHLTLTSSTRAQLLKQPISKLKAHLSAYGIPIPPGVAEKNDLVDLVINARDPNGVMPAERVRYYRRFSIPARPGTNTGASGGGERQRGRTSEQNTGGGGSGFGFPNPFGGMFSGDGGGLFGDDSGRRPPPRPMRPATSPSPRPQQRPSSARPAPPRPQQQPQQPQQPRQQQQPPQPRQQQQQQQQQQRQYAPPPYPPPPPRPSQPPTQPPSSRPTPTPPSAPAPTPPRPPTPTIDELARLPPSELSHLSISALKSVLEHNHVNTHLLVEKSDLVAKVRTLVEQAIRERERLARLRELEEQQTRQRAEESRVREQEAEDLRRAEEASRETYARETGWRRERMGRTTEFHPGVLIEVEPPPESPARRTDGPLWAAVEAEEAARVPLPQSPVPTPSGSPTTATPARAQSPESPTTPIHLSPPAMAPPAPPPPLPAMGKEVESPTKTKEEKHRKSKPQNVEYDLSLIGRCVVCQDEEANIAIVDCGHLALCMPCSDLIMKSTRECPLCRTRIVTEQRLLRIYRT